MRLKRIQKNRFFSQKSKDILEKSYEKRKTQEKIKERVQNRLK